ncbi:uncharacterized protein N7484_011293 [Penicillium longicatenatum]|uniref:uncharacterized protein n=1 Tax=Penicillium longicatenatum TaxID=1561947 RepID=UPI002547A127|nr:uncharacterized protein N7484_011293 [Penicillium longicatenatum]KAJ5631193.1 hypothetical protein N7484_011293 [Penicillium longicatenatum]
MPRPKKSKAEDLARVRNNQRKCRERRRDYLAELEQKLELYENERIQCSADFAKLQATAHTLRQENEILRKLLRLSNISENDQSNSLADGANDLEIDREDLLNQTQRISRVNAEPGILQREVSEEETLYELPSRDENSLLLNSNGAEVDNFIASDRILSGSTTSIYDAKVNTPTSSFPILPHFWSPICTTELKASTSTSSQAISSLTLWPVLTDEMASEDRTILCSIAYRLILQSNKRRYSESEIDSKLCRGFRQGRTQSEKCRVDNEVLFALLSEISS